MIRLLFQSILIVRSNQGERESYSFSLLELTSVQWIDTSFGELLRDDLLDSI